MQGIFSFVRYYRKEIFVKKEEDLWAWENQRKNAEPLEDEVLYEIKRKNTLAFIEIS